MSKPKDADRRVEGARDSGDRSELAAALVGLSNQRLQDADLAGAVGPLHEAASLHGELGETEMQARLTCHIAMLSRGLGKLDIALIRAGEALELVEHSGEVAQMAAVELAEAYAAKGQAERTAQAWAAAIDIARAQAARPAEEARMHQKRAAALGVLGRFAEAAEECAAAADLYRPDDDAAARRATVEYVSALYQAGDPAWSAARDALDTEAAKTDDELVRADLRLLDMTAALAADDAASALDFADRARAHALEAVAPVQYVTAFSGVAEAANRLGDRQGAYNSLATGLITLAELIGMDEARSAVEPLVDGLRRQWGDEAFLAVKSAWEQQRREALGLT